jgi:hypothetical protein
MEHPDTGEHDRSLSKLGSSLVGIEVVEEVGLDPSRDGIDPLLDHSSNKRFSFFT